MTQTPGVARVVARNDETLSARVVRTTPLRYSAGADETLDRPAHVRAASGIVRVGERLVVVQDDASFIALVNPPDATVQGIALPSGPGGRRQFDDQRGNKAQKLDLEAVVVIHGADGPLVAAFGSGSTSRRQSIVLLRGLGIGATPGDPATVTMHDASGFFAGLRAATAFAGSELNIEGVALVLRDDAPVLRFFNRGNGAPRGDLLPVNASCDVSWASMAAYLEDPDAGEPPLPDAIVQYELGAIGGIALTFTDVALAPASRPVHAGPTFYVAAAEASPDAISDGPVAGGAVGVIEERSGLFAAKWTALRDEAGNMFEGKVEGIAPQPGDPLRAWVVVDRDEPEAPSELCEVKLDGPWFDRTGDHHRDG